MFQINKKIEENNKLIQISHKILLQIRKCLIINIKVKINLIENENLLLNKKKNI